jgi:hypothetical protein
MVRKGANRRSDPVYVFCAVRGSIAPRDLGRLPAMPHGDAPRAVSLTKDITLVASDVPAATYRTEVIESRLQDLDWVARCGEAHHGVADALAPRYTVVPFRLFTLFSTEEKAVATLSRAAKRIDEALEAVKGKTEWVLRITKPDLALAAPEASAPTGAPATSGTSFLAQKAAAKQAAANVAARIRGDVSAVFARLAEIADQANERSVEPATGFLLDAAFLVPSGQIAAFKRALESGSRELLRNGCRVSLTGPWPPYSFVALESRPGRG